MAGNSQDNADAAAEVLSNAGFDVSTMTQPGVAGGRSPDEVGAVAALPMGPRRRFHHRPRLQTTSM
ncbi:hypothetical protein [Pseudarthrobacter sp. AB1]|uniref:hypothetical protein n=1 Tax=Pseudarthrobacter sp. AB1 TaxID=2138309 RepID=UPI001D052DCE|nr:hypothetical protein [Pseudarthrobacter sp. AB1]